MNEQDYLTGNRAAWMRMLSACLKELGYAESSAYSWVLDRQRVVTALRRMCKEHDVNNDWPDLANLDDVIESGELSNRGKVFTAGVANQIPARAKRPWHRSQAVR